MAPLIVVTQGPQSTHCCNVVLQAPVGVTEPPGRLHVPLQPPKKSHFPPGCGSTPTSMTSTAYTVADEIKNTSPIVNEALCILRMISIVISFLNPH